MIGLNSGRANIHVVAEEWKTTLSSFLFNSRKKKLFVKSGTKTISSHDTYYEKMLGIVDYYYRRKKLRAKERDWIKNELNYFKQNFDAIILAEERDLLQYTAEYKKTTIDQRKYVVNLFCRLMISLYESFKGYKDTKLGISYSHKFFNLLNIRTCPYCNRQYTFTLDERNAKTAPEYDHFYDKSDYPLLAVSFYNLVPSCHTCNHMKGTKKSVKVNPYFSGFESSFVLVDKTNKPLTKAEILKHGGGILALLKPDGSESLADKGNIECFGLRGLYDLHDDYVSELIEKAVAYDATIEQALVNAFQGAGHSPQHVYDFVWGKYLEETQYENRLLSKLTKEILEQLGIRR